MDKTLKATHGGTAKGNYFYMDGKRRISIVIFLNCIQVVSRIKHRKPASHEQRLLMGF
jgi:hypothetical protein